MGQLSHRVDIPFPLFDADNHLYEPPEALTKYLPKEYKDVVQYVEINGRTKIALKGQISNYIPNPTFSSSDSLPMPRLLHQHAHMLSQALTQC